MLPELDNLRYFPRALVPFAIEAGWQIHPESKQGDWAVLMTPCVAHPRSVDVRPVRSKPRKLVTFAGAA